MRTAIQSNDEIFSYLRSPLISDDERISSLEDRIEELKSTVPAYLKIDWRTVMSQLMSKRKVMAILAIGLSSLLALPVSAQSAADCAARAERAERESGSVLGGAAIGGGGGALFGAIVGDNKKATKRGAALGAVAGGATSAHRKNEAYKREYDACMAGQ